MNKYSIAAFAGTASAVLASAGLAGATLPASATQCAVLRPIATSIDCAIPGLGVHAVQALNGSAVTVRLVTGIRANTQGYNLNGVPISGTFVTTTTLNVDVTSTLRAGIVFHDATGTASPR